MKKLTLILLSLVMIFSMVAACGGDTTDGDSAPAASGEPVHLTIYHHMGEQAKRDGVQAWADAVTAANPHYTFEINVIADANQYRQIIRTRIAAGDPVDIMFGAVRDYLDLVEAGHVANITDAPFIANFDEDVIEGSVVNGNIYGIPVDMGLLMVFYNRDIFEEHNLSVPTTYAEFLEICQILIDNGVNPLALGFGDAWTAGVDFMIEWYMMLEKDPYMFRDVMDGNARFADYPMFRRGVERSRERFVMAQGNPFGSSNDDSIQMFASERAAMLPNGTWSVSTVRDLNPDGNFGLFMLPADNAADTRARLFTDTCFMISSALTEAELSAAYAFFNFALSPEGANIWSELTGLIPATRGVTLTNPDPMTADAMAVKESGLTVFADTAIQPTGQRFDILFNFSADFLADMNRSIDDWIAAFDAEFAAAGN